MANRTKTNKGFIKVTDPELAVKLMAMGFSYMYDQDQSIFVFHEDPEIYRVLQREYSDLTSVYTENKLRF